MVEGSFKTCCAKGLERDLIASLKGERERENDEPYMLTRGGYRLIEKDEAYFAGKLGKQILLEARQDAIAGAGRGETLHISRQIVVVVVVWSLLSLSFARSSIVRASLKRLFCMTHEGKHFVEGDVGPWIGHCPGLNGESGVVGGRCRPVAHAGGGGDGGAYGGSARGRSGAARERAAGE